MESVNPPARKPRRGDLLELSIDRLGPRGVGLGATSGVEIAIRGAVPGSRVQVQVTRRRRGRLEARLLEVVDRGPDAVEPRCEHVGSCGGCSFQALAYARQLEELRLGIEELLVAAEVLGDVAVEPVLGCESPWHYRNKMDFTFSNRRWIVADEPAAAPDGFALGLHPGGRHDKVFDVERCEIAFGEASPILRTVRAVAAAMGLDAWDTREQHGLLRHLVLRKGFATGEILAQLPRSMAAATKGTR